MMQIRLASLRTLKPSQRNARTHSKRQIKQIADSISAVGWTYPILVDENGNILAGNGRFLAASHLGLTEAPVMTINGLTETQKRVLALADNKIAANAGWDRSVLAAELGELAVLLPEVDLDISITGFDPAEVDALAVDFTDTEREPADELPELQSDHAVSRTGDLWVLGEHRLICGDACEEAALHQLMGRARAAMMFGDPPYNLRIRGVVGKRKHREFASGSGEMNSAQFIAFLIQWMKVVARFTSDGSIHFVCIDWRHLGEMVTAGAEVYSELKNVVVWAKTHAGQGSFYRAQHELIFVFKNGNSAHQNNIELGKHGRNRSNLWTYPSVNAVSLHPTMKPIAMVSDAIRDCSRRGEIVLDPFIGSGTTILAAERVGRRAFGVEIDPLYVDLAIRRWQVFTGRDAILKATGQTFDEAAIGPTVRKIRRER